MLRHASIVAVTSALASATPTLAHAQPFGPCAASLDSLDVRLRRNYAGFILEVTGRRLGRYSAMLRRARETARVTPLDDCFPVLDGYIKWFEDPHLFVFQSAEPDSAEAQQRRAQLRVVPVHETEARAWLGAQPTLDPIEGIWYDGTTRFAVLRDSQEQGTFNAILLASDTTTWPAGAIRARFYRQRDGTYRSEVMNRRFGQTRQIAHLHKRVVLRLDPGMWGKAFPVALADTGLIDPENVHAARASVRARSVVLSIPSHDPALRVRVDRALRQHAEDIRRTGLLIVDLRGNEGGSSQATRALDPWIATVRKRATPFDSGTAVMLSSPAQVAYVRRSMGPDTSVFVRSLVARLEASPGRLVPLSDQPAPSIPDSVLVGSWHVVMLTDRGTVSAAEVLVLKGLRSTRTIVVGERTAGALDYQSTQIVGLGFPVRRWGLGYPTIAAHTDLPRRGMRGKGITPDVRVDWAKITDPIRYVEERFGR